MIQFFKGVRFFIRKNLYENPALPIIYIHTMNIPEQRDIPKGISENPAYLYSNPEITGIVQY